MSDITGRQDAFNIKANFVLNTKIYLEKLLKRALFISNILYGNGSFQKYALSECLFGVELQQLSNCENKEIRAPDLNRFQNLVFASIQLGDCPEIRTFVYQHCLVWEKQMSEICVI